MNIEEFDYHGELNKAINHIVLSRPQIPQDTGNTARTCVVISAPLHIIRPMGFPISDRKIKRAELDYWDEPDMISYDSLGEFVEKCDGEVHLISKFIDKMCPDENYNSRRYHYFFFGREGKSLPEEFMRANPEKTLHIPMNDEHIRSPNLSNTVYIIVYEVLHRQTLPNLELSHTYTRDKLE